MIAAAWELGSREEYTALNLRRWAHMLCFRGHFLTKSRRYSTTFTAIRAERRAHRVAAVLASLGEEDDDPQVAAIDPETVIVINEWWPVRFGHRDDAERELAAAIAERHLARRRSTTTQGRGT
jgi:hypothetical protein